MKIVFAYGVLTGGGAEKRMGDLSRWLLDNGDEAWIVASNISDNGISMMAQQCGFPVNRIRVMEACGNYEKHTIQVAEEVGADIIDVQWVDCVPSFAPCALTYTMHGRTQPVPVNAPFLGILSVEHIVPNDPLHRAAPVVRSVLNWADTEKFAYRDELPEDGVCWIGRLFKAVGDDALPGNVVKVAPYYKGMIDCYGTVHAASELDKLPPNARWLGYVKPEEVIYNYRVVLATAICALEALAAGRLVIAGQPYDGRPAWGRLVRPKLLDTLALQQFASILFPHDLADPSPEAVYAELADALENDFTEERRRCRQYVEEYHSLNGQCAKVRAFYEEVLAL